jgi:pimeloyl-ACP methyl ester carboxylesterase
MLTLLFIPLGLVLILVGVMLAVSPGKPKPFVDENGKVIAGSISEKTRVNINGVQQGMIIEGKDIANPVLLFLHGGTGMPEYFFAQRYPTDLEQYFTVCWWDRRGAGLSYAAGTPPDTITLDQSISDTLEVTNYLRGRFHKEKIYLITHSGGSLIGIQAAARAPELYFAYIGMAQMAYQLKAESVDYEYMLERYRELGNTKMVRQLEKASPAMTAPLPTSYMSVRDKAMHGLGVGTTHDMRSVASGVFLQSWLCRAYTIREKIHLWRGKFLCDRILWDKMITTDLTRLVPELGLPAYFFHGKYDYTVAYPETRSYFEKLRAPLKGFYTFEQSAHSPMFEEPAKMQRILREDVLKGTNTLADER